MPDQRLCGVRCTHCTTGSSATSLLPGLELDSPRPSTLTSEMHSAVCQAASASAAGCEAYCCKGPIVTSAPAAPLQPVSGPCGAWQWRPGDLDGLDGCWVSVDPTLQKLPYSETGSGPWVGAEGNLGQSSSWGVTLLLVGLVLGLLYISAFGGLNYRRGLRGHNIFPHRLFWIEVWGLVMDGVQLSSARLRGVQRIQQTRGQRAGASVLKPGGEKENNKEKKQKKQKRSNREQTLSEPLVGTTGHMVDGTLPAPSAGGDPGRKQRGDSWDTAAGDGGRWVHVPS